MPRLRARARANAGEHGERRRPGRLVDEDHAGRLEPSGNRHRRRGSAQACAAGRAANSDDDEGGDLLDREVAREPGRLAVAAAVRLARDRGDVDAIGRGAKRDLPRRAAVARRLADQRGELRTLDGAEDVDDALRVRLDRPHVAEVLTQEIRDDDPTLLVERGPIERPREQLHLRELHRLVDALEDALQVGARPRAARPRAATPSASCSRTGTGRCRSRAPRRAPRRSRA